MQADVALQAGIRQALTRFTVNALVDENANPTSGGGADDRRLAAVALAIVEVGLGPDLEGLTNTTSWQTSAALVLTRRSARLRSHPGQWALPGGRLDPGESAEQAALRELSEEVGLDLGPEQVLGRLDDFETRSGYIMTPIVIWGGSARDMTANPAEVASIHRIPLTEFLRDDSPILDAEDDLETPVLRMPVGDSTIAAPTAAILYQFREVCLLGHDTRVAHFEQPKFAWR